MRFQDKNQNVRTKVKIEGISAMQPSIQVVSTSSLRDNYNHLLTSDWKKGTINEILELLWKEIEGSQGLKESRFVQILRPSRASLAPSGFTAEVIDEIRHFRKHFRGSDLIPPVPEELSTRKSGRLLAQAETVWTYLILGNLAQLQGETGFFADTQSLLFLVAVDFLLPSLEDAEDSSVEACLINALYMHTFVTWTQDPQRQAHHFFLQAVLMDYLGDPQLKRDNLYSSLNLSHLEDHSYLTKVQAYVFSLIDCGENEAAKKFLMKLYRHAPEGYLSELEEMIDAAQGYARARGK